MFGFKGKSVRRFHSRVSLIYDIIIKSRNGVRVSPQA
jgi:hypothetical protein